MLAKEQMQAIRAHLRHTSQGLYMTQIGLEISPSESLVSPLALARDSDMALRIQSDDVNFVIWVPPCTY